MIHMILFRYFTNNAMTSGMTYVENSEKNVSAQQTKNNANHQTAGKLGIKAFMCDAVN